MKTLRAIRHERHLTMQDLAYLARVSIHTICDIETTKRIPHPATIDKICSTLRLCPDDVTEFTQPDRRKTKTKMRAFVEV